VNPFAGLCSLSTTNSDGGLTIGACNSLARPKDIVVIAMGCPYPLMLRPRGGSYDLVTEIYVQGYMTGENIDEFSKVEITLV
jgi:hypothetical protein